MFVSRRLMWIIGSVASVAVIAIVAATMAWAQSGSHSSHAQTAVVVDDPQSAPASTEASSPSVSPTSTAPDPASSSIAAPTPPPPVVVTSTVVVPPPAAPAVPAKPQTITVVGQVSWESFIGGDLIAEAAAQGGPGFGYGCAASDGAVTIKSGSGAILRVSSGTPTVSSSSVDAQGDHITNCEDDYRVTVPRSDVYQATFTNPQPAPDGTCSGNGIFTVTANDSGSATTSLPKLSFYWGCA